MMGWVSDIILLYTLILFVIVYLKTIKVKLLYQFMPTLCVERKMTGYRKYIVEIEVSQNVNKVNINHLLKHTSYPIQLIQY